MAIYRFNITRKVEQFMDVAINADTKEQAQKMVDKIITDGNCPDVNVTKEDIRNEMNRRLKDIRYSEEYALRDPGYISCETEEEYKEIADQYVGGSGEEFRLTYTPQDEHFDVQLFIEDGVKELPTPEIFGNLEGVKLHANAQTSAYLEIFGLNTQQYVNLKNFFLKNCEGKKTLFKMSLAEGRHDPLNRTRAFTVTNDKLGEASRRELAKRAARNNLESSVQAGITPNQIKQQLMSALMGRPGVGFHIVDLRDIAPRG